MYFQIKKDKLKVLERDNLNSGSVKFYESIVEYDELWQDLIIEAVLIKKGEKQGIPAAVINNVVYIDQKLDGIYYIGFCGFKEENDIKTYQISTNLEPIRFDVGAGSIEVKIESLPTLNEWEIYVAQIQKFINESKDIVAQAENLNLEVVKEQDYAILTITRKDGTEEQVYIYDGKDYILTEEDKTNIIKETKAQVEEELSETLENNLAEAKNYSDSNLNKAKEYSNENLEKAKTFSNSNLETSKEYSDNKLKEAKEYSDNIKPTKTSELTNDSNYAKTNENNNFSTSQTVNGTLTVNGDIVQNGETYETHAEKLYTEKDEIILRDKAIGGMTEEQFAGLVALLYNGIVSGRLGFKADGTAYVGDIGDEQPLLTRDDVVNLTEGQVLIWDGTKLRAVGSSDFVKNTDYASSDKGGVVKVTDGAYGLVMRSNNVLGVSCANTTLIDAKENTYRPIVPSNLDYAVKQALAGAKIEWSNEEQLQARNLINAVGKEDYAGIDKYGIVKFGTTGSTGLYTDEEGKIYTSCATTGEIDGKVNMHKVITPANLDYAVREALINTKLSWSDEEKTALRKYFNIIGTADYATSSKAGIMRPANGLFTSGTTGAVLIAKASNAQIDARTDNYYPIVSSNLDYAVGSVKASETQSGTMKVWTSVDEDGEIGLNISTEV